MDYKKCALPTEAFIEKEHIALNILRSSLVKPHILSFPQVERVGNPSENKERFRTSRNDREDNRCQALKCESKESYGHCPYFYFFPIKHYNFVNVKKYGKCPYFIIDNGKELFGDATPLLDAEGNVVGKAEDGFAALAQEDTNSDGVVNAQDARWNDLRIWQDLNQDGISKEV